MTNSTDDLRLFDIVLTGRTINDAPLPQVADDIAKALHISGEQVSTMLAKAPVFLKRSVNPQTADRIRALMASVNAEVMVQPASTITLSGLPSNQISTPEHQSGVSDTVAFAIDGHAQHAYLTLKIPQGHAVFGDGSAIICLDPSIRMSRADGDNGLSNRYRSYITRFCAEDREGELCLASKLPGAIVGLPVTKAISFRVSCYLASSADVDLAEPHNAKSSSRPMALRDKFLECRESGTVWLSGYGGVICVELHRPFRCRVDRLLAWRGDIVFTTHDDAFIECSGPGTLWLQGLSESSLVAWGKSVTYG